MEFKLLLNDFISNIGALREFVKLQEKYDTEKEKIIKNDPMSTIPQAIFFLQQKIDTGNIKGEELKKIKTISSKLKMISKSLFKYKIEGGKTIKIEPKNLAILNKVKDTLKALKLNAIGKEFIISSTLINLLCIFEKLFRELVLFGVNKHPNSIKIEDNQITYSELCKINSIEETKDLLISQYIEDMFRHQPKDTWFKKIEEIYDFKVDFFKNCKLEFVEIIERRNILTHNDGKVNTQYINNVDTSLITKFKAEKGKYLSTNNEYLASAIDIIEVISVCLIIKAWRKINKEDKTRANFINSYIVYPRLKEERNYVAKNIAEFIKHDEYAEEITKDIAQINYWLAIKQEGNFNEIKVDVDKIDYSSKPHLFQLGIFALKDDQDRFFTLLETMIKTKEFDLEAYYEYPIFREMRKTKKSKKMFPLKIESKKNKK